VNTDRALVQLGAARTALAECRTVMEAKHIADAAEAARVYLERTNASAETVNHATEIRLLAERQMGEFLKQMPDSKTGPKKLGNEAEPNSVPTLAEIGITKKQSATAQKLAAIPAPEFAERLAVAQAGGEKLSTAKVLSFGRHPARKFVMKEWQAVAQAEIERKSLTVWKMTLCCMVVSAVRPPNVRAVLCNAW